MTGFTPELVERRRSQVSRALYDAYANHDYANGSVWAALADAALEASGIAELTEALSQARAFIVVHGPAEAFPDLLATIDAALMPDRQEA